MYNPIILRRGRVVLARTYGLGEGFSTDTNKLYKLTVGSQSTTMSDEDFMALFDHYLSLRQEYVEDGVLLSEEDDD